jgi:hypothetical protein
MRRPAFGVCAAIEQNAHCTETLQTAMDKPAKFFTSQNYRWVMGLSPLENPDFSQKKIKPAGTSNGDARSESQTK